jgi:hypothetical protein
LAPEGKLRGVNCRVDNHYADHYYRWTPKYWLEQIDRINAGLGLLASSNPATPIKIAILDTGCNTDADFFSTFTADDERLDGDHWYDWVRNEARPIDEHGHGTAIVTLMLRMVRNAEIFVARVAKDTEGLQHAEDNIAEVRDLLWLKC